MLQLQMQLLASQLQISQLGVYQKMRVLTHVYMMRGKEEQGKLNICVAKMYTPENFRDNKAKTDRYTLGAKLITELWVIKQLPSYLTPLQQNTDNKNLQA